MQVGPFMASLGPMRSYRKSGGGFLLGFARKSYGAVLLLGCVEHLYFEWFFRDSVRAPGVKSLGSSTGIVAF